MKESIDWEARKNINPNKEILRYKIGGEDFNIPNGYSFEYASDGRTGPAWPLPNQERSEIYNISLIALVDGMKPWSNELDSEFKIPGNQKITRITISINDAPEWLENQIRAGDSRNIRKSKSLQTGYPDVEGLIQFEVGPPGWSIYYLTNENIKKPYFLIAFISAKKSISENNFASVIFDYTDRINVKYLLPVTKLKDWKKVHEDVVSMLNSFTKK